MTNEDLISNVKELLNKDRLEYMEVIMKSDKALGSLEVTKTILSSRGITDTKKISRENIKVNKRLRRLVELGLLMQIEEGTYSISSLGYLLMDSWNELSDRVETTKKFRNYFDTHYVDALPPEFFRQTYKLRKAKVTENPVQWMKQVTKYTGRVERKFYNLTEYLHDIPEDIIEKKTSKETEEFEIVITYQFYKYPLLNYSDEKELFDRLVDADVRFHYLTLEKRHPIGLRIVDDKWATFGLTRISDGVLDREKSFVGTDKDFVSWCRDLMYHIWHFKAKPLNVEEVIAREEE